MSDDESRLPTGSSGSYGADREPHFFDDPGMDRFVAVLMNLASEVWTQDERLRALEVNEAAGQDDDRIKIFINRVFAPLREPGTRE